MSIDRHLQAILLRCSGDNRRLAKDILENIEEECKRRLYHILNDLEMSASRERSKRRRGQFW